MLSQADARAGILQALPILSVSKLSIITVFMCDCTVVDCFCAAVADIRGLIKPVTAFPAEVRAGLVTGGTGGTFDVTQDDFTAYIGFSAVIAVHTEVMCIVKRAFVVPVAEAVVFHLF